MFLDLKTIVVNISYNIISIGLKFKLLTDLGNMKFCKAIACYYKTRIKTHNEEYLPQEDMVYWFSTNLYWTISDTYNQKYGCFEDTNGLCDN